MSTQLMQVCLFLGIAVGTVNAVPGAQIDELFERADVVLIGSLQYVLVDCSTAETHDDRGHRAAHVGQHGSASVHVESVLVGSLDSETSTEVNWTMAFDLSGDRGSHVGHRALWFIRTIPQDTPSRDLLHMIVLSDDEAVAEMIRRIDKMPENEVADDIQSVRRILADVENNREARTE